MIKGWLLDIIYYIPDWIATFQARRNKEFMEAVKKPQKKEDYVSVS